MSKSKWQFLGLAIALALTGSAARSDTKTWTGTGNWNATNWAGGVPGTGDTAVIASGTVTLTGSVQVLILSNAGTLTFSGWDTILTASNVIIAAAGTVNHTAQGFFGGFSNRVQFVCTNLTVSGSINVAGCGYAGGTNSGYGTNGVGTPGGGGGGLVMAPIGAAAAGMAARAAIVPYMATPPVHPRPEVGLMGWCPSLPRLVLAAVVRLTCQVEMEEV